MSKYRYDWWPIPIRAVMNFPRRKKEYAELHGQSVNQKLTGVPGGGGVGRTTEIVALRKMAPMKQLEYDAVTKAIAATRKLPDGEKRIELIDRMYWRGRKLNISQVIYQVGVGEALGKRWHRAFIALVGKHMGYFL